MDTILVSSGIIPPAMNALRHKWQVIDIVRQREALAYLQQCTEKPLAVAVGYASPKAAPEGDLSALQMLQAIQKIDPTLPVIISTATSDIPVVVDLIKRGAFDYVVETGKDNKPAQQERYTQELVLAFTRATQLRQLQLENAALRSNQANSHLPDIQARSPQMRQALELTRKVAPTPATVLITGESGTGKELIARAIHQLSPRRDAPFLAINCGALSEQLLTSELFGHVKGAFTGADSTRPGLFQQAGEGTLFLDEIGTVPLPFQVMLLRVLEERTARPVGGSSSYPVNCRFIAAANRDLEKMIHEGSFREDLWYRLNIFSIQLPPLRQRTGDIAVLAHHFLQKLSAQYGKQVNTIAPAAMTMLEEYHWPGNVRQLRNVIERALIVAEEDRLRLEDFDMALRTPSLAHQPNHTLDYTKAMRQFEHQLLTQALTQSGRNLSQAARLLNINRTTLLYRLKKLDIDVGSPA